MPLILRDIVKSVLEELKSKGILPTPENYRKLFCQKAKEHGFDIKECNRLSALASKLSSEEQSQLESMNIVDIDELFDFIVQKLREKEKEILPSSNFRPVFSETTVEKIASLMMASLAPSCIEHDFSNSIDNLTQRITSEPALLEHQSIQNDIEYFIEKRKIIDKRAISDKTDKLSMLINKMDGFIDTTVSKSGISVKSLEVISSELKSIEFEDIDHNTFDDLRDKMIDITNSIQDEANTLSMQLVKEQGEVAILKEKINALEEHLKDAQEVSSTDFLTGTMTRREYEKQINSIDKVYQNYGSNFVLIFIDLDHFKSINDTYGHNAGDVVLSTFGKLLLKKVNNLDIIARYGGEEFVIVLQNSKKEKAKDLISKISDIIRSYKFVYEDIKIKLTFSAGISSRNDFNSLDDCVKNADNLLYRAKNNGRDRIEV